MGCNHLILQTQTSQQWILDSKNRQAVEKQDITSKCMMHYVTGGKIDKMRPHRMHL